MMDTNTLNQQFGIENHITFKKEKHSIIAEIKSDTSTARVSLYGAQVLSFIPHGQTDLLFVSEQSFYQDGKAIRGGIPVCWPWFGAHPSDPTKPSHGLARLSHWNVLHTSLENGAVILKMQLRSSNETLKLWPFSFEAVITVKVSQSLRVEMVTKNTGDQDFSITGALHSYFNVNDCETIHIEGLHGCTYLDDVNGQEAIQREEELQLIGEVDRCYMHTEADCRIHDPGYDRTIRIRKWGSQTTVVWNPGGELAEKMKDLGHAEYQKMVCVEAANARNDEIRITPGQAHRLATEIQII